MSDPRSGRGSSWGIPPTIPKTPRRAEADGADYLGSGTVYPTTHKRDLGEVIGPSGLRRVIEAVSIPVVGIGGITQQTAADVAAVGAQGIAVIGAVMSAPDPRSGGQGAPEAVRAGLTSNRVGRPGAPP